MVVLNIQKDGEREYEQPFDDDLQQITVGRKKDNVLVLDHNHVSGYHALFERRGEEWVVIDRTSTNGTFLNGDRLPADVATPLPPGARLEIGPFAVWFADPSATIVDRRRERLSSAAVVDELAATWARLQDAPAEDRSRALRGVLQKQREAVGSDPRFAELLGEVAQAFAPAGARDAGSGHAGVDHAAGEEFYLVAHRTLTRLSCQLLGRSDSFSVPEDIERFGELLQTFVHHTTEWIVKCCDVRETIRESFGTEITRFLTERNPIEAIRNPQDVAGFVIDWTDSTKTGASVGQALTGIFRAFVAQHAGVLKGAQAAAEALLTSLSPEAIEREARGAASTLGAMGIAAARKSALWMTFLREWTRLAEPGRVEAEIVGPKMKEAFRRMTAGNEESQRVDGQ